MIAITFSESAFTTYLNRVRHWCIDFAFLLNINMLEAEFPLLNLGLINGGMLLIIKKFLTIVFMHKLLIYSKFYRVRDKRPTKLPIIVWD